MEWKPRKKLKMDFIGKEMKLRSTDDDKAYVATSSKIQSKIWTW